MACTKNTAKKCTGTGGSVPCVHLKLIKTAAKSLSRGELHGAQSLEISKVVCHNEVSLVFLLFFCCICANIPSSLTVLYPLLGWLCIIQREHSLYVQPVPQSDVPPVHATFPGY